MNAAALIQLAISAAAVAALVGLAAWATRGRGAPPLDEAEARRWLADEFPGRGIEGLWLATDGMGAVAKSADQALVLTRMGDGYAARRLPWAKAAAAGVKDGRVRIGLSDPGAPRAVLAMAAWPPKEFTA
ncbi:MAG: hypothetical protein ACXWKO_09975 [Phenylobacterium sp.]